jgi:hypothetical protein
VDEFYQRHLKKSTEAWKVWWDKRDSILVPMRRDFVGFDPREQKGWFLDYDQCNARCHKLAARYPKVIAPNV